MTGLWLISWLSLHGATGARPAIVVSAEDLSLRCALVESLPPSLERLLPGIATETENGRDQGWLELNVTATVAGWWFVLESSDGYRLAERMIPYEPLGCEGATEAIALIVERALRDIGWEPHAELLRLPTSRPVAVSTELRLSAGPMLASDRAAQPTGGGRAAFAALRHDWLWGFELGALSVAQVPARVGDEVVGRYRVWSTTMRAAAGTCREMWSLETCALVALGAEAFFAEVEGKAIRQRRRQSFVRPVAGIELRLVSPPLVGPLRLGVSGGLTGRLWPGTFVVDGVTTSYQPRSWVPSGSAYLEATIP